MGVMQEGVQTEGGLWRIVSGLPGHPCQLPPGLRTPKLPQITLNRPLVDPRIDPTPKSTPSRPRTDTRFAPTSTPT